MTQRVLMTRRRLVGIAAASPLVAMPFIRRPRAAETHEVRMLNQGETGNFVFEPRLLHVSVGDTVRFVPETRGHNCVSIEGMIPPDGEPWRGEINKEVSTTITAEGVYGYQCEPHYTMGMVGLIVAGDPSVNLEQARTVEHPRDAAATFEELFAELAG